ncbi:MAG: SPFH domain-containing protein [Paludibacter sp.]|nr:SPFH domain-containing protein [Paludibacter sp.]
MFLLKIIFWILLLYGIVGILISILRITVNEKPLKLPFRLGATAISLPVLFILSLIVKIGAQDVGVVVTPRQVNPNELHTGWHLVMWWNDVFKMDKTVWVYTCANAPKEGTKPDADAIWVPTKDGIKLGFDVSVSWHIDPNEASWIYANVSENDSRGDDGRYYWLEDNVVRTKLKSAMALTVLNFNTIEAYSTKRQDIQNDVSERIKKELALFHMILDQVDVREIYYNVEYEKAINAKKLAEQEVLRLVEVTRQQEELKKQEAIKKDIVILTAQGESQALQIKGQSISNNPKVIELEWIQKWNGQLPTYMLGDQGIMLNLSK